MWWRKGCRILQKEIIADSSALVFYAIAYIPLCVATRAKHNVGFVFQSAFI